MGTTRDYFDRVNSTRVAASCSNMEHGTSNDSTGYFVARQDEFLIAEKRKISTDKAASRDLCSSFLLIRNADVRHLEILETLRKFREFRQ